MEKRNVSVAWAIIAVPSIVLNILLIFLVAHTERRTDELRAELERVTAREQAMRTLAEGSQPGAKEREMLLGNIKVFMPGQAETEEVKSYTATGGTVFRVAEFTLRDHAAEDRALQALTLSMKKAAAEVLAEHDVAVLIRCDGNGEILIKKKK